MSDILRTMKSTAGSVLYKPFNSWHKINYLQLNVNKTKEGGYGTSDLKNAQHTVNPITVGK